MGFCLFDLTSEQTMQDSKGKDVDLSIYKGKVVLVVNVASKWLILLSISTTPWSLKISVYFPIACASSSCSNCWLICLDWNSGFTNSNYPKLTELYEKYRAKGMLLYPLQDWMYHCLQIDYHNQKRTLFGCEALRFKVKWIINSIR